MVARNRQRSYQLGIDPSSAAVGSVVGHVRAIEDGIRVLDPQGAALPVDPSGRVAGDGAVGDGEAAIERADCSTAA